MYDIRRRRDWYASAAMSTVPTEGKVQQVEGEKASRIRGAGAGKVSKSTAGSSQRDKAELNLPT